MNDRVRTHDEYEPYAALYDQLVSPFVFAIRKDICRIARKHRFERILDICCGTGQQCIMLSRLGFKVTGVDLSHSMLAVAGRKSPKNIAYFREDAAALHFDAASFDCAILSFALHEKEHRIRTRIVREAMRILDKRGRLLMADYLVPDVTVSRMALAAISLAERMAGDAHYAHFRDYLERGALPALIEEQGLELLEITKYHLGATGLASVRAERID